VLILYRTGVVLTTHIACPLTDRECSGPEGLLINDTTNLLVECEFIHARSILTCVDRRCCLLIERECIDSEQRWTVFNFPSRIQQLYGYHCAEIRARILSAVCPNYHTTRNSYLENVSGPRLVTVGEPRAIQCW
jgi:hypothetical protein